VVGDATHGDGAFAVTGGEGELEFAAGGDGVVVEELVEVAHPEEEQRAWGFLLGCGPLTHEGGQGLFRGCSLGGGVGWHGRFSDYRNGRWRLV